MIAAIGPGQHFLGLDWFSQVAAPASIFVNRNLAVRVVVVLAPLGLVAIPGDSARARVLQTLTLGVPLLFLLLSGVRTGWVALMAQALVITMALRSGSSPRGGVHRYQVKPRLASLVAAACLLAALGDSLASRGSQRVSDGASRQTRQRSRR